ncbi:MAG: N(2)-fixation sustaining protein CowN [Candidatus Dactylopiibacterium carminicum]|uniref:N(2)-fixation sustaining protein CowN n=1 Tax=Candidatus Dactylopiibacterium carminicum TaxID=857335 RepID=A0A272EVN3_9RHOO|nr:N(2)-fixation sustaining protein CowN [Candidatus Dactylopiibacterium carminicum]KAF7599899.1 N(2)-fixation sustaining protein CowN [Candidatus Dactylopiibacterium carminicum]PAS94162.1 MAG: N(2)-fixation sustaining protein CowN [Candidatus Dactylopiibacterium carminicum]PAS96768.1 MAG: N(2)-fixation sustaining protein CowN [Candidatus Dactylopiibacterium carminicum]PAS99900.1 MAG: N(2)-fixation sustaining protein CowN [Candidatus Dactylopiibacterium carminicum]
MSCSCQKPGGGAPDRYVSFSDIDCDGNARLLMEMLYRHLEDPAKTNAFWEYFKKKAAGETGPQPDDLFMVHCHLNQLREFFETHEDREAQALLEKIEEECC